jgi:hypothetical protein
MHEAGEQTGPVELDGLFTRVRYLLALSTVIWLSR